MEPDRCEADSNKDKSKDDSGAESERSQSAKIQEEEKLQNNAGSVAHAQDRINNELVLQGQSDKNKFELVIRVRDYKYEEQKSAPEPSSKSLNESDFEIYELKHKMSAN